jgi:two-component system sensor histidine kinase KdpD
VVGVVETHGRVATAELAGKLEQVVRCEIDYRGTTFQEMDVDAILARIPQVVLVDELAHTNVEGSRFSKRYEDVLLVLDRADEIVISDLTPEALVTRMRRGDIYPMERVERSLSNFFRRGNLIALREMALQRVTRAVDRNLDDYVKRKKLGGHWTVAEKIAVCVSSNSQAHDLIARGARLAEALDAELYVLHVESDRDKEPTRKRTLEAALQFARNIGASVINLVGSDTARATADFIRENRITQAIVGRSATHGLKSYLYYLAIQKLMSSAPHVDLHIVTQENR